MKRFLILWAFLAALAFGADQEVIIDVKGMHCPLCVAAINQALRNTDGVIYAKSSLKTEQAQVIVPEGYDLDKLLKAIETTGYTGTVSKVTKIDESR